MIKNTETVFEITADEKRLNISIEIAELVSLFKLFVLEIIYLGKTTSILKKRLYEQFLVFLCCFYGWLCPPRRRKNLKIIFFRDCLILKLRTRPGILGN